MGLKERIEALEVDGMESGAYEVGFETGRYRSAQLAAEADELMAEMAEAINDLREFGSSPHSNRGRWAEMKGCSAVMKYNKYKETQND